MILGSSLLIMMNNVMMIIDVLKVIINHVKVVNMSESYFESYFS